MEKYDNMAKSGSNSTAKGCPVLDPWGVFLSNMDVQTRNAHLKSHKYAQVIFHNGYTRGHNAVLDTVFQQYMVGMGGWEITQRHGMWIYSQGVNTGVSSKAGRLLLLVNAKECGKNISGWEALLSTF